MIQVDRRYAQTTLINGQEEFRIRLTLAMRKGTPAARRGPEGSEIAGLVARPDREPMPSAIVVKAAEHHHRSPARHGTRIVIAAFGLIPRIAALADRKSTRLNSSHI